MIPNKAFQAIACGTPLVTADTPAARELLVDGESALLVPPGDPRALAAAIRRLAADPSSGRTDRRRAASPPTGEHASEDVLGARWRGLLERLARRVTAPRVAPLGRESRRSPRGFAALSVLRHRAFAPAASTSAT